MLGSAKPLGLQRVRGDDGGTRHERLQQRGQNSLARQLVTAARCEHRVEHERHVRVRGGDFGDGAHVVCGRQHADLECRHLAFGEHAARLARHELRGDRFELLHAARVLHREPGEHRQRMAAERGEREQIGLQPGAAGGIGRRERQNDRGMS